MNLIIDKEFKTLIPPLSEEEYIQLEENCVENGIQDSLKVWDGILIDGHNRYEIAQKHGLEFKTEEMNFAGRTDVKYWIIKNQLGRRNLSAYDRSVLALKLKPVIAEKAKEKQVSFLKQNFVVPQKSEERRKEIEEIKKSFDYDTAQNLICMKKEEFAKEDRRETMADEKYIYFARFGGDKLKIGSSYDPNGRVKQLSVACPGIELVEMVRFGKGSEKHENNIKKKFSKYRIENECYQCDDNVLKQMISYTRKERARKDDTNEVLAKVAGVSHDTIHKVEVIEASGDYDLKQKIRNKDISINKAYKQIRGIEDKPKKPKLEKMLEEVKHEPVILVPAEPAKVEFIETEESAEVVADVAEDVSITFAKSIASEIETGMTKILNTEKYSRANVVEELFKINSPDFSKDHFKTQLTDCIRFLVHLENCLTGWN